MSKRQRFDIRQFIAYMVSGTAAFWAGYVWFFAADKGLHMTLFWNVVLQNFIIIFVNFLLQHFWVFGTHRSSEHVGHITTRYVVITGITILLTYIVLRQLKTVGISPYIGQFITAALSTPWNWFWYKYWVFVHKPVGRRARQTRAS